MISILFYGTSEFAVPSLEALLGDRTGTVGAGNRFKVVGVVTQPDRPVGRHATMQKSAVKIAAEKFGIPVLQFEQVKSDEALEKLSTLKADVAVVASFGQIIPQRVLDLYKYGMVNVHSSLLPKYRGASPITAAIANGDEETGVTIMLIDAKMDHGPILDMWPTKIEPTDTTATLTPRLAELGAELLARTLPDYIDGKIKPVEQDHDKATTVKLLNREDGRLDPATKSANELERLVRANDPWPGTFIEVEGKRLKVLACEVDGATDEPAGTRYQVDGMPALACADSVGLILTTVQPEGKPPLEGAAFLRGARDWS
ncbi:methionyl-tRNA formyltransferase [Candidatus Uhrbacteria bacterium]|nr:methionyl-tRNA formyltransferase [Candidatus Uhrbacteria bacterium]